MSWTYHEYIYIYITNMSWIYQDSIRNISWTYHEHITKSQPTNSKDWPFSLGFSHDFRQDATTLRGEHAGAGRDLSELWECAGLRCAKQPMACHAWKCGPHEIWVENRTSFVPKHQGFLKNTFLDAQKGTVWGLKPQILAYSCWYFPVFCCSRWLLVINCSFWNEQM